MDSEIHLISKTAFLKGIQCEKAFFIYRNRIEVVIDKRQSAIGFKNEVLVRKLFGVGINLQEIEKNAVKRLEITQKMLNNGTNVLFEATFMHHDLICSCDVVVNCSSGLQIFEIKSAYHLSKTILLDAAFQLYILKQAGYTINAFSVLHPNKRGFRKVDILKRALALLPSIEGTLKQLRSMIDMPKRSTGKHCMNPYTCQYIEYCTKEQN